MGDFSEDPCLHLRRVIGEVRRSAFALLHWRGLFAAFAACGLCLLAGVAIARAAPAVGAFRGAYWALLIAVTLATYWWHGLRPRRRYRSDDQVALLIQREAPGLGDAPINVVQLQEELRGDTPFSRALVAAYLRHASERTRNVTPPAGLREIAVFRYMAAAGGTALLMLLAAVVFPGAFGDGVRALVHGPPAAAPAPAASELRVSDLAVTYYYPDYLGAPARTVTGSDGTLRAPKGTQVSLEGRFVPQVASARLVVNDAVRGEAKVVGGAFSVSFPLLAEGTYRFESRVGAGDARVSEGRPILLESDESPVVRLTWVSPQPGPDGVAEADVGGMLEISYQCEDDHGIGEVFLEWTRAGRAARQQVASPGGEQAIARGRYEWTVPAPAEDAEGEISVRVGAKDNDNISGPKEGFSRAVTVRLITDEVRHRGVLAQEERLRRLMVCLLAEELTAPVMSNPAASVQEMETCGKKLLEVAGMVAALNRRVMEETQADPLADKTTYDALCEMQERRASDYALLQTVLRVPKGAAPEAWAVTARPGLSRVLNGIVAPLEDDILRLDDLVGMDRLRAAQRLAERLGKVQKELQELLRQTREGKLTAEQLQEVKRRIAAMKVMMDRLEQRIAESARRIEREFLNPDAFQTASAGEELQSALDRLQKLAESGDLARARAEAEELEKRLNAMMSGLQGTGREMATARLSERYKKLRALNEGLRDARAGQAALHAETKSLDQGVREAALQQEGGDLAAFWRQQIERAERVEKETAALAADVAGEPGLKEGRDLRVQLLDKIRQKESQEPVVVEEQTMEVNGHRVKVRRLATPDRDELAAQVEAIEQKLRAVPRGAAAARVIEESPEVGRRVADLKKALKDADVESAQRSASALAPEVGRWRDEMKQAQSPEDVRGRAAAAADDAEKIRQDLAGLSERVQRACRTGAAGEMGKPAAGLAQRQHAAAEQLEKLARDSGGVGGPDVDRMVQEAGGNMRSAGGDLAGRRLPESVTGQQRALGALDRAVAETGKKLEELQQNMQGQAARMVVSRSPREGGHGYDEDRVKIPDPSAYKVPQEFREQIQDALRDGLPDSYREANERYYEELVR